MDKCMNYIDAFEILEIDKTIKLHTITLDFLKKKYHKLSLQNHPDKHQNSTEYTVKFQQIKSAYDFLQNEIRIINNEDGINDSNDNSDNNDNSTEIYSEILNLFMKNILNGNYNEIIVNVVKELVIGCKKVSMKLFDNLDKETTLHIYEFLSNNRSILHLSNEILNEIRELLVKQYDNVNIYKLNPSIHDLLDHNMYKLYIDSALFLVPLWHNEVYFDNSGCEIIVICEPELPSHMSIDDDNNILYETTIDLNTINISTMISENECFAIDVGKEQYKIPYSELYMKKEQYYRIKNRGLSKIKNDIYDISDKADIIVKILIV